MSQLCDLYDHAGSDDDAIAIADDLTLACLLLVSSDPQQGLARKLELESQGYYVICAHLATEALQLMQWMPFDLVIVDTVLPDMHGLDLISQIAARTPHLPIILAAPPSDLAHDFRSWTADAVVDHTSSGASLLVHVMTLLQGRKCAH
ncbi:MAG: response regulator [candidate division KSB1 bacterium]|nr:response regulator [candidate division KSB1 bacterium]MDZ7273306.1 response regulator [candidate division KSB1 bacterium]MDZ7285408.1 response regulator [candidate division KSB1 bacterium]MDZ7298440.1 response regulator [candidate division KSB1 bacterium]MDZ7308529.1 response regulator [candidate division KSB1 bacterium]